jgi:diacylglycerol kinase family enzyme
MTDLDEVSAAARQWTTQGRLRALVAAGGDGTVAELVNRTLPATPITTLPMGTENLFAKSLWIPFSPRRLARQVARGRVLHLDAASANTRVFVLMLSCGIDADVIERLAAARQGHISHFSYIQPTADAIRDYRYPPLTAYCDGAAADPMAWVHVINISRYALGYRFAPRAKAADGWLDVCGFRRGGTTNMLRYYLAARFARHERLADCYTVRARHVRIESDAAATYQIDGDPGGKLPVDIDILPRRLTIVGARRTA